MSDGKLGIHAGHRARMREKFSLYGRDIFHTHELLEMLLYHVIPYKNTNPIAKNLLDRFGSLDGVLSASRDELISVDGVGPKAADMLLSLAKITPDGVITISRSVNVHGDITHGKNRNAKRTFLLPERAKQALTDQQEYLRRIGLISPYVFPNALGEIAKDKFVYNAWQRFCKSQGIAFCSLYELRHTMVSYSADVPDALLKPMVGHSRSMDTRGVYGHEVAGNRQRTVALLESAFESALDLDATLDAKPAEKTQ